MIRLLVGIKTSLKAVLKDNKSVVFLLHFKLKIPFVEKFRQTRK